MIKTFSVFYWEREKKRNKFSNNLHDIIVLFHGDKSDHEPLTISLHAVLTNNEQLLELYQPILFQPLLNVDRLIAFKIIQSRLDDAHVEYTINNTSDKDYRFDLTIDRKNRLEGVTVLLSLGMKPIHQVSLDNSTKQSESQQNLSDYRSNLYHDADIAEKYSNNYGPKSNASKSLFRLSPTIQSLKTKLNDYNEKVKTRSYRQAEQRKKVVEIIQKKIAQLGQNNTLTDTEKLKELIAYVKGCIEATLIDHKKTSEVGLFSFMTTPELVKALRNALSHLPKSVVNSTPAVRVSDLNYEKEKSWFRKRSL